jgi:hypothetical protein
MGVEYTEYATFYRAALLLGLIRGERVVAWADAVIAAELSPPEAFAEIATCAPDDLTRMRQLLLLIGREKESDAVVRALVAVVGRDLTVGRRTIGDTMTVLKQLRAFVAVSPAVNEQLKTLGVDVAMSPPATPARAQAEDRVRTWLAEYGCELSAVSEP